MKNTKKFTGANTTKYDLDMSSRNPISNSSFSGRFTNCDFLYPLLYRERIISIQVPVIPLITEQQTEAVKLCVRAKRILTNLTQLNLVHN